MMMGRVLSMTGFSLCFPSLLLSSCFGYFVWKVLEKSTIYCLEKERT